MEVSKPLLFCAPYNGSHILSIRKHVYRDLHPYVCLVKSCTKANQDFQKRTHWARHMLKEHWRNWKCPFGCLSRFKTSKESRSHVLEVHPTQVSIERVEDLVALSSNTDLTCAEGKCPFCLTFEIRNSRMYESHVGKHLEQLALFALPQINGEESAQGDDTGDDQHSDWEINSREGQVSDMESESGHEALPRPDLETEGDHLYDEVASQSSDSTLYSNPDPEAFEDDQIRRNSGGYDRIRDRSLPGYDHQESEMTGDQNGNGFGGIFRSLSISSGSRRPIDCEAGCGRRRVYEIYGGTLGARIYSRFCKEHTCQVPRNDDTAFCINPRNPSKRYCSFHGKCHGGRGCTAQAPRPEKEPFPYICPQHRCTEKHCTRQKFGTHDVCEAHLK